MARKASAEERRTQIIEAAARCFARKGFHLTSMDDIVAESGLSKGSLYWHFESKDDILIELTRWYFQGFEEPTNEILSSDMSCEEKLRGLMLMFATGIEETRELMPVMMDFMAHTRANDKLKDLIKEIYTMWIGGLAAELQKCIDKGELRPFDVHSFAAFVAGAYDGLILQDIFLDRVEWQRVTEAILGVLFDGIRVKGGE